MGTPDTSKVASEQSKKKLNTYFHSGFQRLCKSLLLRHSVIAHILLLHRNEHIYSQVLFL